MTVTIDVSTVDHPADNPRAAAVETGSRLASCDVEGAARQRHVSPTHGAGGDEWDIVLTTLYETHYDSLCRSAARLVDSHAAAEDVVQEAFVRYQLSTVQPAGGSELSYLRSIVLNTARSVLRRRATARNYARAVARQDLFDSDDWLGAFGIDLCVKAMRLLSVRQREVVAYRILLDYSESDTAHALSISPGAVKTHLSRAREVLRIAMDDWAHDGRAGRPTSVDAESMN